MALNFKDELIEYCHNKTRVLINGLGEGSTKGTIKNVYTDYIEYELINIQVESKGGKTKTTTEIVLIPIQAINTLSTGETETTKTALDGL